MLKPEVPFEKCCAILPPVIFSSTDGWYHDVNLRQIANAFRSMDNNSIRIVMVHIYKAKK